MQNIFLARYDDKGIQRSIVFDRSRFNEASATAYLSKNNINNFLFFFEPYAPTEFGDNGIMIKGEVGFDITTEILLPFIAAKKEIIVDSFGGDLWEGLKMYDAFKALGTNPSIGVIGSCASATTMLLLSTDNSWITENSRYLIHNPWTYAEGDDIALDKVAASLRNEKLNIANIYARETGRSVEEMVALMSEEKFITAADAVEYGFIKEIRNKVVPNKDTKKDEVMNKENEELKKEVNEAKGLINQIKNLFKGTIKNLIVQDVNGVEIDFYEIETEDQIAVGVMANVDGGVAEGDYVYKDGRTFTFVAGVLDSIADAPVDDLEVENAALTEQVAELQNSITKLQGEHDLAIKAKADAEVLIKSLSTKIEGIESKFSNNIVPPVVPAEKKKEQKKFTYKLKK